MFLKTFLIFNNNRETTLIPILTRMQNFFLLVMQCVNYDLVDVSITVHFLFHEIFFNNKTIFHSKRKLFIRNFII